MKQQQTDVMSFSFCELGGGTGGGASTGERQDVVSQQTRVLRICEEGRLKRDA